MIALFKGVNLSLALITYSSSAHSSFFLLELLLCNFLLEPFLELFFEELGLLSLCIFKLDEYLLELIELLD